ncbi:MAG: hypothetical protein ABR861_12710 [Terriglobales bacterium]|jgi:hypothetical protein
MKYATAQTLGKQVCDAIQMLEALGVAFNHNEGDKKLQQVIAPALKCAAHLLGPVLDALNTEEMSSPGGIRDACSIFREEIRQLRAEGHIR